MLDSPLRLILVAENPLARAGLRALLEERGCVVIGQSDGTRLGAVFGGDDADAVALDLGWRSESIVRALDDIEPTLPVLALVAEDETQESLMALHGTLAAFPGYGILPRDSDADVMVGALAAIAVGLAALDPRMKLMDGLRLNARLRRDTRPLTARENEVLQLLAAGLTNRAIALELGVTQHTVKFHVKAIMVKLAAQSRTEAVVLATRLGLIVL